ncbi:hypothetical protein NHX12_025169 [Muraenolepis orangiensis]|uniref:Brain-specific angiogenesis inhibitor 1-associated protein 2 n=1 Tax=Muraenolepis orangiensis TaxID=630683 RepID=A0A9Q0EIV1_9TELE|nr:hypothetical protein NHX12_025169 [Muraenolepis orangiensis]
MAEVHRQIQIQLEEMAALKKYQTEHKSKGESLEKCQAELKKLRRKSQGSKHPSKYGDKEMQYVEAISSKQSEMDSYVAEGYKNAVSEERRRYCFLGKELLSQKVPAWQQACAEPNKLPERAMLLAQQMSGVPGPPGPHGHHPGPHPKGAMAISDPIPGAKPLPVPPELAALMGGGALGPQTCGAHGGADDYQQWMEAKAAKSSAQGQAQGYSNTLPVRKGAPAKHKTTLTETRTLPRSSSMAAGLERNGRTRVQAIFSHAAGDNGTLLSFSEGDIITLLVPEARDGWHYGENEKNRMRGWFPFSYTRLITDREEEPGTQLRVHNLQHGKSSSTGNLLEREDASLPLPDYSMHSRMAAQSAALVLRQQPPPQHPQRPYSMGAPGYPQQAPEEYEQRFPVR